MGQPGIKSSAPHVTECSVCIPNYNGESYLEDCINSVLNQACDFKFELIVHDDASEDGSVQLLRSVFPEVTLIESKQNLGFCESSNRMVERAEGKYILLLNNDAELLPDALSVLHARSQELRRPAILTLPQYDYDTGALVDKGSLVDLFMNPVPNLDPNRRDVAMVIGACLWIPRELWHRLGGFPAWFESLAEDMYLCTLARMQGIAVQTMNESGYRHRSGASFGGGKVVSQKLNTTIRRRRLSERNKSFTLIVCYPSPWLQMILPLHLLTLLAEGLFLSVIKWESAIWREVYWNCIREIWRNRGRLREHRGNAQKHRVATAAEFFSPTALIPRKLTMLFRYGVPRIK